MTAASSIVNYTKVHPYLKRTSRKQMQASNDKCGTQEEATIPVLDHDTLETDPPVVYTGKPNQLLFGLPSEARLKVVLYLGIKILSFGQGTLAVAFFAEFHPPELISSVQRSRQS